MMSEKEHKHNVGHSKVRVHIDRKQYESPNPTTGSALYALGHVFHGFELFQEVEGNQEDKVIPNDGNEIHLKEDEHFYSTKEFKIIVNGRPKEVTSKELSFTEIVSLAFSNPPTGENILFTVTYEKGKGSKPEGTLVKGQSVHIKNGMIFNVTATDKS